MIDVVNYSSSLEDKVRCRVEVMRSLDTPRKQAIAIEYFRNDLIGFVNSVAWTFDPRGKRSIIPFYLFPRQEEYLRWREQRREVEENGVIEKSRDVGATFLNCIHQLHCWLFEEGFAGGFGSRKEDLVDKIGDPKCIFEKLRFMLYMLPSWLLPEGFDRRKHDSFCKLINPSNSSTITGEAGENIGRGGRTSFYDWDEVAFTPRSQKVDAALSNNTNTVFYTSSANGIGNLFYQKRSSYPPEWLFRFEWFQDPRKSPEWLEEQKQKYDEVTVASEILIDYTASIEGIFIPAIWVAASVDLEIPAKGIRKAGLDVATTGKNLNVFTPRHGAVVFTPKHWKGANTTETAYKALEYMEEMNCKHLSFDSDGVGAGVAGTYGTSQDLRFTYTPISGNGRPSDREWVGEMRTSADKFANKRAELWGLLRDRFRKTYNYVNHIAEYPLDELISIPNHPSLIAQLSTPLGKKTSTGKTLIESKEDMLKRGVGSPDFADSLAYSEEETTHINYLLFA